MSISVVNTLSGEFISDFTLFIYYTYVMTFKGQRSSVLQSIYLLKLTDTVDTYGLRVISPDKRNLITLLS